MFDAKKLLDMLAQGAARNNPPPGGGGGALEEMLRNLMPGAAPSGGASSQSGGILGDILAQLQPQGGPAGAAPRSAAAPSGGASPQSGGVLGDILAKLQQQGGSSGGGLMDILGQVLGQATQGAREGAQRIDDATGASRQLKEALGQATGKSPDELIAQLKALIANNQLGAGAVLGGLGALVLGTSTGRSVMGNAAKLGALALIGGLAYKAYQNYSAGLPVQATRLVPQPAPEGSGFEERAVTNESAALYIRAMISAAAADGRLDSAEQQRIIGSLQNAGIDAEAEEFLAGAIQRPASVEELTAAVGSDEEAIQLYTAARIAIEPDTDAENRFLSQLARRLGIAPELARHIDAAARTA